MRIFQLIQKCLAMLGIKSYSAIQTHAVNCEGVVSFLAFGMCIFTNIVYLAREADSFFEYVESLYLIFASSISTVIYAYFTWYTTELFEFIGSMETTIQHRLNRHPSSKNIYEKANRRVEKWSKFIYFYIVQISPLILLPKFIISFFYYFTTDVGNDSFELMISMWFPFDTNNPTGYILAFILQYIMAFYLIFSTATMINLGIGTYLLATSLSNDLLADLHHFIECKLFSEGNKIQALKQIANFCRMHSTSKRILSDFSNLFQPVLMIVFLWCSLSLCGILVMIQIELSRSTYDTTVFIILIYQMCWSFSLVFIGCELCQRLSNKFNDISYIIEQFEWHSFSFEMWKLLPMIILNAQATVAFKCFGSIASDRDTFKKVINGAFSYFMVLRQFSK